MPLLKYWFEDTSQNARPLETPINPKRVTATTPSSSVKTLTSEEKETKKLAVEQQKLQRKIRAVREKTSKPAGGKKTRAEVLELVEEESEEESLSETSNVESCSEKESNYYEEKPGLTKAQIRAEEKLRQLNSINRDLQKTASRSRVISRIKAQTEKKKQAFLEEQNSGLKKVLQQKERERAFVRKISNQRKMQRALERKEELQEKRMSNIEKILQTMVENNQQNQRKEKKSKSLQRAKAESSTAESSTSSSDTENEEKTKMQKKRKQVPSKKNSEKSTKEKSEKEKNNFGTLDSFIKSLNK